MLQFDPRSLIFVSSLLGLLCSVVLFVQRRSFPATIQGIEFWALGSMGAVVASILFGLRNTIPDVFTVVMANGFLVGGFMLIYVGLLRFFDRRENGRLLIVTLALMLGISAWWTFVHPNYRARVMLITWVDATLLFACARLAYKENSASLAGRFTAVALAMTALVSVGRFIGTVTEISPAGNLFDTSILHKIYLASFAFSVLTLTIGLMMMANERLRGTLEYIAAHDALSGAFSRRTLIDLLEKELARSQRHRRSLALLMFDLDNFKLVNDRFGHLVGDRVIVQFVRQAETLLRKDDYLGRYGGEEFIALLPETTQEEAVYIAERICEAVAGHVSPALPRYTVSIGVAITSGNNETTVDSLLALVDKALYAAKQNGRNRVETAAQPTPEVQRVG